jgi:hypothetical protein
MNKHAPSALKYWKNELSTKGDATKEKYQEYFNEF